MVITDLELNNYRKHRKLRLKFNEGITGIVGDNAAGKSTIIEAINFVLTGDLFSGKREDAISLGEDSGYVTIKFILNEKNGTLQRWLTGSKVQLTYDGVTYKKATEVKELWDKLLQIGPEIISKVIIAQQGNIPFLFSGDNAIREKVFQKIFLVPNTEKIRSSITKNYLKQLPPLLAIENIRELETSIETTKNEVEELKTQLSAVECLTNEEVDAYKAHLQYLIKCENDVGSMLIVDGAIKQELFNINETRDELKDLEATMALVNIQDYEKQKTILLQQRALYAQKLKLEAELINLQKDQPTVTDIEEATSDETVALKELKELSDSLLRIKISIENNDRQIDKLSNLSDHSVCFTCGQPLHSTGDMLKLLREETEELIAQQRELERTYRNKKAGADIVSAIVKGYADNARAAIRVNDTLKQFKDIEFSEEDLTSYTEVIDTYREYEKEANNLRIKLSTAHNKYKLLNKERDSLAVYTGENLHKEKEDIAQLLASNVENTRFVQSTQSNLRMKEYVLNDLQQRLVRSKENQEKNKKRNRYSELLNLVNDTFQTSNFPRKLVLNYAEVVSEYLQEKLQDFNMPYTARVADNFKIEMLDDDGNKLPDVSGGQKVQIGIALHIALHELFSQSFPLLIIDEGTTHLDATNRKAYFDIIKKLKSSDKLQQIIIIDHDEGLADVVDHIISLNTERESDGSIPN